MPRPQSEIWQYFDISESDDGRRKAECKYCGHQQFSGVTRLHQHLLRKCTAIPENIRIELLQKEEARSRIPSTAMAAAAKYRQQPAPAPPPPPPAAITSNGHLAYSATISTLHGLSSTPPLDTPPVYTGNEDNDNLDASQQRTQSVLDYHLARALFSADIPMKVVENPYMADFLRRMRPGYVVPNAQTLQQYLLKEQHWDLIAWKREESQTSSHSPAQNSRFLHDSEQQAPQSQQQQQQQQQSQSQQSFSYSQQQQQREQTQAQERHRERDIRHQQNHQQQDQQHMVQPPPPLPSLLRPPPPPAPSQLSQPSSQQQNSASSQPNQQQHHHPQRPSTSSVTRLSTLSSSASSCSDSSSFGPASTRVRAPTELDGSL